MALMLAEGVTLRHITAPMAFAAMVVEGAYRELGCDAIITCADGGKHSNTSLHYVGAALDFRTNFLTGEQKQTLHAKLVARLGPDFDAVLESTHLHVEAQPKTYPEVTVA